MIIGGEFIKTSDITTGDKVTFLDEGRVEKSEKYTYDDGNPKISYIFKVKHKDTEADMRVNATSRKQLAKSWGVDTARWVGKTASCLKEFSRQINADCIYLDAPQENTPQGEPKEAGKGWDE